MGSAHLWIPKTIVYELGSLGVVFFFVLSGFLITYLLLREKSSSGTVAVGKFYLRRILRIWPLYFFIIVLGFFVMPQLGFTDIPFLKPHLTNHFYSSFLLYIIMLPNLAFAMFGAAPHIGQTWSIGVEEQFYLLWPLIVKHSKSIFRSLILVIGILVFLKAMVLLAWKFYPESEFLKVIKPFLAMTKMESMAIGGLGAYFLFDKEKIKILYSNVLLVVSLILIVVLIYFTPDIIQDAIYLVNSVLFLLIIVNVSCNPNCFLKLENKLFRVLGNISYGIYMYHMIVIAITIGTLKSFGFLVDNSVTSQLVVYSITIVGTVLVAWLSYTYLESWFLKLKGKFTVIKSGSFN